MCRKWSHIKAFLWVKTFSWVAGKIKKNCKRENKTRQDKINIYHITVSKRMGPDLKKNMCSNCRPQISNENLLWKYKLNCSEILKNLPTYSLPYFSESLGLNSQNLEYKVGSHDGCWWKRRVFLTTWNIPKIGLRGLKKIVLFN